MLGSLMDGKMVVYWVAEMDMKMVVYSAAALVARMDS